MARFLVTGASGFIGKRFLERLRHDFGDSAVIGTSFSHSKPGLESLDMADRDATHAFFQKVKPKVVIHCAAMPGVNQCEIEKEKARLLNLTGTQNIVDACKAVGAMIVFLSTNYVFDGKKGDYTEEDPTHPLNQYGRLKLEAERYIQKQLSKYIILRTTNVFGYDPDSKNFVMTTIATLKGGKTLTVAVDQDGNPTHVDDLVAMGLRLIQLGKSGVYNAAGPDNDNRLEFSRKIASAFGLDPGLIVGKKTEELKELALRPKRANFDISKIVRQTGIHPLNTLAGLEHMRDEMKHG
ncbi:MAG: SDR family oxidoreductase [Nanoarchaeota archaeon]